MNRFSKPSASMLDAQRAVAELRLDVALPGVGGLEHVAVGVDGEQIAGMTFSIAAEGHGRAPSARMRLGVVILPELRRAELAARPGAAPRRSASTTPGPTTTWPGARCATRPGSRAVPTLAAAALATERIRLGTLVASPNFRHPVPFARELIALDDLSGGRFTLGIGAGRQGLRRDGPRPGAVVAARARRALRGVRRAHATGCCGSRETSYAGRYYSADEARSIPGCVQQPRIPFAIAATGPRGMRLAAAVRRDLGDDGRPHARRAARRAEGARVDRASRSRGSRRRAPPPVATPRALPRLVLSGVGLDAGLDSVEAFRDTLGRYADGRRHRLRRALAARRRRPTRGDLATLRADRQRGARGVSFSISARWNSSGASIGGTCPALFEPDDLDVRRLELRCPLLDQRERRVPVVAAGEEVDGHVEARDLRDRVEAVEPGPEPLERAPEAGEEAEARRERVLAAEERGGQHLARAVRGVDAAPIRAEPAALRRRAPRWLA